MSENLALISVFAEDNLVWKVVIIIIIQIISRDTRAAINGNSDIKDKMLERDRVINITYCFYLRIIISTQN